MEYNFLTRVGTFSRGSGSLLLKQKLQEAAEKNKKSASLVLDHNEYGGTIFDNAVLFNIGTGYIALYNDSDNVCVICRVLSRKEALCRTDSKFNDTVYSLFVRVMITPYIKYQIHSPFFCEIVATSLKLNAVYDFVKKHSQWYCKEYVELTKETLRQNPLPTVEQILCKLESSENEIIADKDCQKLISAFKHTKNADIFKKGKEILELKGNSTVLGVKVRRSLLEKLISKKY